VGNCALYVILIVLFSLATSQVLSFGYVFLTIGIVFLVDFAALAYFSRSLLRLTGSISVQGKKVTARLTPLCIVSSAGTFLFGAYLAVLSTVLFSSGIDAYYTFDGDAVGPFIVYFLIELCPSAAYLYIMSISTKNKRPQNAETIEFTGVIDYGSNGETMMRAVKISSGDNMRESLLSSVPSVPVTAGGGGARSNILHSNSSGRKSTDPEYGL
jgi:hypothetical protein